MCQGWRAITLSATASRERPYGSLLHSLRWVWGIVWETAPRPAIGLLSLQLCEALGPLVMIISIRGIVNSLTTIRYGANGAPLISSAAGWIGLLFLGFLLDARVIWYLRDIFKMRLGLALRERLIAWRMDLASDLPLRYLDDSEWLDLLKRSEHPDRTVLHQFFYSSMSIKGVIQIMGVIMYLAVISPWLSLALLVLLVPYGWFAGATNKLWLDHEYKQTELGRRTTYLSRLLTGHHEQKDVRVFTLHRHIFARWTTSRQQERGALMRVKRRVAGMGVGLSSSLTAVNVGVATLLALTLARHHMSPGLFVALFQGVMTLEDITISLSSGIAEIVRGAAPAEAVQSFMGNALAAVNQDIASSADKSRFPQPLREGIVLADVSFHYGDPARPVLRNLSFHISPGEHIAIVGANGSGKSTLVKLLLGLYTPTEGSILADGKDYREIAQESLRNAMNVVFQDFHRFELSVAENIGIGLHDVPLDGGDLPEELLNEIQRAAMTAGIADLIDRLPGRYKTPLGVTRAGGVDLSGGEWQRIALSRAFVRRNAALWVLDEPTAALDPAAEADLYSQFASALPGKTALLVSHRLGITRMADRIIVMSRGRMVENGTHTELLRRGGAYATMWREQSKWYR